MPKPRTQDPSAPVTPPELRDIEARLAAWAESRPAPPGLAGRVFDASVGLLPRPRLRLAAPARPRQPVWRRAGGGLALAASVALAFVVASRLVPESGVQPLTPDVELALLEYAGADADDLRQLRDLGQTGYGTGAVEPLLVTRDMTFRDLAGDLAQMAADLEM